MSKAWGRGSTRRWRRIRAVVLARNLATNQGRCQLAIPGTWTTRLGEVRRCLGQADCVHHPYGKRYGDDPAYLMAACTPCNLKVGDPTKAADPKPEPRTQW